MELHRFQRPLNNCQGGGHSDVVYLRGEDEARALSGIGGAEYAAGRMLSAYRTFSRCLALCERHALGRVEAANRFMPGTVRIYLGVLDRAALTGLGRCCPPPGFTACGKIAAWRPGGRSPAFARRGHLAPGEKCGQFSKKANTPFKPQWFNAVAACACRAGLA